MRKRERDTISIPYSSLIIKKIYYNYMLQFVTTVRMHNVNGIKMQCSKQVHFIILVTALHPFLTCSLSLLHSGCYH